MKPLKVLSIDWDYLVNATLEQRLLMFPDCCSETMPTVVQDLVWSFRYHEEEELERIEVDYKALNLIKKFIHKTCNKHTFAVVYDSHKFCFDEVMNRVQENQPIEIINVDFHHDMYGNNLLEEVDCGNWVNCLFEGLYRRCQETDKYYWVAREDSDVYSEYKEYLQMTSVKELSSFDDFECDLLFICRSSVWSPPHLDDKFTKLYTWIDKNVTKVEVNITGSRYTKKFRKEIEQYRASLNDIKQLANARR